MQTNSPPKLDTTKHTCIFHYHKQSIVSPPKQNKQVICVSPFLSRIDKDYLIRRWTENIRNRIRENKDNSPYEEQQLPLRTTKVKKNFPPYKNRKNKTSVGKNSFGKK